MSDQTRHLSGTEHIRSLTHAESPPSPVPLEFIEWAYRLFLDREPDDVITTTDLAKSIYSSRQLRDVFMGSEEYQKKAGTPPSPSSSSEAKYDTKLDIDLITDRDSLLSFFNHVKTTWTNLGETEPHWSVLSAEEFKSTNLAINIDEFKNSGRREVDQLFKMLGEKGIYLNDSARCIEYGCGVGRVTRWLADRFNNVTAFDISKTHVALAEKYLLEEGVGNARLRLIEGIGDIENIEKSDFFYSVIVLQHNPPPIIELIVFSLARSLKKGGYGVFQVPVFSSGYSFSVEAYLSRLSDPEIARHIEMHILQVDRAYRLIFDAGCVLIDTFDDNWAGPGYKSRTFLIYRP